MARKRQQPRLSHQQMNTLLMGPNASRVSHAASPEQFKRLRLAAKRRGVTVDSLLSGTPGALQQRTREGILKEARRTVASAYRPAYTELSQQDSQIRALDSKRASDNLYYQDWLRQQSGQLIAAQDTFDRTIFGRQDQLGRDMQTMMQGAQQQLAQGNQDRAGSVTQGTGEQQAAQGAIAPQQGLIGASLANQAQYTAGMAQIGAQGLAAGAQNNAAAMAASDARRRSETQRALLGISNDRERLRQSQAADTQRETSRLGDQEITKANAVEQLQAALQGLGLRRDALKLDAAKAAESHRQAVAGERLKRDALNFQMDNASRRLMLADNKYRLDLRKYDDGTAKDNYLRLHGLGPYKPASGKGGSAGALTQGQQNDLYRSIDIARGRAAALRLLRGPNGERRTDAQIVAELTAGIRLRNRDSLGNPIGDPIVDAPGAQRAVAQAAVELARRGVISRATLNALKRLGIAHPGKRYTVADRYVGPLR